MPVKADFDAEVKIGGIAVLLTVAVVDNLSFDLILGFDFFREAHAIVNLRTNTLSPFDGLTEVPMTAAGEYPVVSTYSLVTIPPLSEAVFPVVTAGSAGKRELRYRRRFAAALQDVTRRTNASRRNKGQLDLPSVKPHCRSG
jgi:hypothetical protein